MPTTTADQGIALPIDPDAADNPVAFANFVADVETRLVRRYTTEANRTALMAVLVENALSTLSTEDRIEIYNGAAHVSLYTRSVYARTRTTVAQALTPSSAVLQNVTNMVAALPGIAGAIFQWRSMVFYDASSTADIKFAHTIPAGATQRWGLNALSTSGTQPLNATAATSGTAIAAGATGVGTILVAWIEGEITMGATAGNLQLQAAQNSAEATNINIQDRSRMEVWRVS